MNQTNNEKMCSDLFKRLGFLESINVLSLYSEIMHYKDDPKADEYILGICQQLAKHEQKQITETFSTIRQYFKDMKD